MSSEIWKIGQEQTAQDYYRNIRDNGIEGCKYYRGDVVAVKQLINVCNEMIEDIDDNADYVIEWENDSMEIAELQSELEAKIQKLLAEIKSLEQKEENGTITDSEREELLQKKSELNSLRTESRKEIKDKSEKLQNKKEHKESELISKKAIAVNYGEQTVEKGEDLLKNRRYSFGFYSGKNNRNRFWSNFRTISIGPFSQNNMEKTNMSVSDVGNMAVETGNELLKKADNI